MKITAPKQQEETLKDFAIGVLGSDVLKILKKEKISKEQYVSWLICRFKNQVFAAGLVVSLIVFLLFSWISYSYYLDTGMGRGSLIVGMLFTLFFTLVFLVTAFTMRDAITVTTNRFAQAADFVRFGLLRGTSLKFVQSLSSGKLLAIADFDHKAMEKKAKGRVRNFTDSKRILRSLSHWLMLGTLVFAIGLFLLQSDSGSDPHSLVWPIFWGFIIFFPLTVLIVCVRAFLHGLQGFLNKDITFYDGLYTRMTGALAQFLGVLMMLSAVVISAGVGVVLWYLFG